jgi:hypothetical protein
MNLSLAAGTPPVIRHLPAIHQSLRGSGAHSTWQTAGGLFGSGATSHPPHPQGGLAQPVRGCMAVGGTCGASHSRNGSTLAAPCSPPFTAPLSGLAQPFAGTGFIHQSMKGLEPPARIADCPIAPLALFRGFWVVGPLARSHRPKGMVGWWNRCPHQSMAGPCGPQAIAGRGVANVGPPRW